MILTVSLRLFQFGGVLPSSEYFAMTSAQKKPAPVDEFASFMLAYQDMVYSTATRLLGNDRQAEDIAQEVFVKAYEQFETLRTSESVGGWLKTVTTNMCLNHLSRYRKRWRLFSEYERHDGSEEEAGLEVAVEDVGTDSVVEILSAEEQQRLLEEALLQLPDHQRVPLVLYHFDGVSYEEISRQLDISLSKLKTDLLRGRAALVKALQHHAEQLT